MGMNTLAFILNDHIREIERSPRTAAWMLVHPPLPHHPPTLLQSVATQYGEPFLHTQALEVLPCFHSSQFKFFVAGGNCITELEVVQFSTARAKEHTVKLHLPSWWKSR